MAWVLISCALLVILCIPGGARRLLALCAGAGLIALTVLVLRAIDPNALH